VGKIEGSSKGQEGGRRGLEFSLPFFSVGLKEKLTTPTTKCFHGIYSTSVAKRAK
jgi:hypothetical protein